MQIQKHYFLFCLVFLLTNCAESKMEKEGDQPPIPLTLLQSQIRSSSPEADPADWLLAHIDVETTGLLPAYHEMIDIGLVITNLKGDILDSLYFRIQPEQPNRTSPIAREVNAFDAEKWEKMGALSNQEAVDSLLQFHQLVCQGRPTLMVAFNSHFDLSFLDHLFRSAGHSWRELYHYFVLDLPSMAWSLGYQDLSLQRFREEFAIADEPQIAEFHTGISGAMKNVRIYRKIINQQ